MADISAIKLPNNTTLNLKDASALKQLEFANHSLVALTRAGTSTTIDLGEFDTLSVTDLNAGNLVTTGVGRFTNGLYGDLTGHATSATSATKLSYQSQLTTQAAIDGFIEGNKLMAATFKTTDANNIDMGSNDGMIISVPWANTSYGAQIALDDITSGSFKFRGRASNTWGNWRTVIHDGNYTSYTVTKDGTGASGTWGISITGNAATATSATSATSATTATNATKATQDSDGNAINTTYMKKSGGTFTGAVTLNADPTANLHAATKQYVDTQLANGIAASDAMVFRGTMGTGGTVTSLPTANVVVGDTYKAISAITVAAAASWTGSQVSAKSGDLVVAMANTPKWIIVPSGDESSGVTSVATGVGLTGGTITGTGTIKAKLKSETNATYDSATVTNTSSRQYAVVPDKSGYLSVNVPWTAYSGGTGISVSNGVINHSNAVTAGTAGTSSATSGPTIAIPYVTYDAQGHVTAVGTHTHTVNGALSVTSLSASSYVTVNSGNSGTSGGLALYSTTPTTYGITMRQTSNQGKHGYVQGDWAIYNHMSGATNRGFVWKLDSNSVASISGLGHAVFNGSVTVGGNAGNTSGCRMEFDSTLKCVNWIFN